MRYSALQLCVTVCYGALLRYVTVRYGALRLCVTVRYGGALRSCLTAVRYGALRCVTAVVIKIQILAHFPPKLPFNLYLTFILIYFNV